MHNGEMMSGGGGDPPGIEQRLSALEYRMTEMNNDVHSTVEATTKIRTELGDFRLEMTKMFGGLEAALSELKGLLESKASVSEVSHLQGSIRSLPTVWQLITLVFGILAGVFAIVRFGLHST